jgi:autotransporter-associated beta strand protein
LITASGGLGSGITLASSLVTYNGTAYDLSLSSSTSTSEVLTASLDTSPASLVNIASLSAPGAATNVTFTASSPSNVSTSAGGAPTAVNSLTFSGSGAVSIAAGNTLTINGTNANGNSAGNGITVSSGAGAVTIGANVAIGSAQTWTSYSSNPFTVNGVISGPQPLTLTGGGAFTFGGANTFTAGLTVNNSTLNLKNASALGTGTLTLNNTTTIDNTSGSPLTLSTNNNQIWNNAALTFAGSNSLNMGSGAVSLTSNATLALNGNALTLGSLTDNGGGYTLTTSGAGNLNVAGNVSGTTGLILGGTGTVTLSGNSSYTGVTNLSSGVLNLTGSSTGLSQLNVGGTAGPVVNINTAGTITLGNNSAVAAGQLYSGAINQTNGTVLFGSGNAAVAQGDLASSVVIGGSTSTIYSGGAYGSYVLTNGTLASNGQTATTLVVGSAYGLGVFTQTGGTLNANYGFQVGNNATGVVTFTGGTASFGASNYQSQTSCAVNFGTAGGAGGTLNLGTLVGGNATLNLSYGVVSISGNANLNTSINLNAGTLIFSPNWASSGFNRTITSGQPAGTASINLNGAQIITASPSGATLISPNATVYDYNGGANINVSTGSEIISSPILAPGGYGIYKSVAFSGTANGSAGSGYVGAPEVTVIDKTSGSSGSMAQAIANVNSAGNITGFTFTNPGTGYQAGDVLQFSLLGGGATTPAGTYNYTLQSGDLQLNNQGGLVKTGAGTLILGATNTYPGSTNVASGTIQLNTVFPVPVNNTYTAGSFSTGPVTLASGTGLNFNPTIATNGQVGVISVANTITGSPALVQQIGAGTTILGGAANYVGPTNISAGTLVLQTSLPSSSVSVTAGTLNAQTPSGSLNIGGTTGTGFLTVAPGANFSMVDGTLGTLNVNASGGTGLTVGAGAVNASGMSFDLGSTGTDLLAINGTASVPANSVLVSISPLATTSSLPSANNSFSLITATSGLNSGTFNLNTSTNLVNIGGTIYNLYLAETGTAVVLAANQSSTSVANLYWGGTASTAWNTSTGGTNWFNDSGGTIPSGLVPAPATNVFFSTSNANTSNTTVAVGVAATINTLSFSNAAPGPITINGPAALTINNTALLESAGTGQGITLAAGAPAVTLNAQIFLGGPQVWNSSSSNLFTIGGNVNAGANALTIIGSGNVSFASTSTFNSSSTLSINVSPAAHVTLAGATNFSGGGINITSGTLVINSGTALTGRALNINSGFVGLTGSNVTLDSTVSGTALTTASAETWGSNFTFLGTNSLNLGSGAITVNNTNSGVTEVNLSNSASTLTMAAVTTTGQLYFSGLGNAVINGVLSGGGGLTDYSFGTVTLNAVGNTVTGTVFADDGTLNISGTATITGGGSLAASFNNGVTTNYFGQTTGAIVNYSSSGVSSIGVLDSGVGPTTAGAIYQTNGTINAANGSSGQIVLIGGANLFGYGQGYYQLSGGTLNVKNNAPMIVGNGGVGAFVETAGSTLNTTGNFSVGDNSQYLTQGAPVSGGVAAATFIGGTFNAGSGSYGILIGNVPGGAADTLSIGTRAGGNATVVSNSTAGLRVSTVNSYNTTSTLNLNSGILQFNASTGITKGAGSTGSAVVNLNGAVVTAGVNNAVLIDGTIDSAYVYNGGAIFNTNSYNATVSANLQPATGAGVYTNLAMVPVPVLSGQGAGYDGTPVVTVTDTSGPGTGATAIANISGGAVVGVIMTSPGQNYQAGDQLNFSFSGGGVGSTFTQANTFTYTLAGNDVANNSGGLLKTGLGTLTLTGTNSYTGGTNVAAGILALPTLAAFPANSNLTIVSGASTVLTAHAANAQPLVFPIGALTDNGTLDITNNAIEFSNTSIGAVTLMAKAGYNSGHWNGSAGGLVSSLAASDTTHLTAVGTAINLTSFEGNTISNSSLVFAKYTYYGDANLDGTVSSADYTLIDAGYLSHGTMTGWQNGDFNYDGVINGSDYTLIDNAFNTQGVAIASEVASPTAQIAGGSSAVPEPGAFALLGVTMLGLLGRRRRK